MRNKNQVYAKIVKTQVSSKRRRTQSQQKMSYDLSNSTNINKETKQQQASNGHMICISKFSVAFINKNN